jgi:hypothetical protein
VTPAERQKRYRARKKRRRMILQIEVHDSFVEKLIDKGVLTESAAAELEFIERAAQRILASW